MSVKFNYQNMNVCKNMITPNFLVVVNQLLLDIENMKGLVKINVSIDDSLVDVLSCNDCVNMISSTFEKKYDLTNQQSIISLIADYENLSEPMYKMILRKSILKQIKFDKADCTNENLSVRQVEVPSNLLSPNLILEPLPINKNQEQCDKPTFIFTKIPELSNVNMENINNNVNLNDKNDKNDEQKNNESLINIVKCELTEDEKNMLNKMSDDEIQKAILKLETIKNDIDKELEYEEEVKESKKMRQEKAEKKRQEEKKSIFESDKSFTYKKIYADMFINTNKNGEHYIKSFDQIPELFIVKYVIFLYMDGKNTEGKDVRTRLLDTPEEYTLYEMLYNVLTNEDYVVPEDEKLQLIVEDFIDTMPPIQIITEEQIMKALNDPNDPIFNEDETSQCSAEDEYGDTKITGYEM